MSLIPDADGGLVVISMSDVIRHPLFGELQESSIDVEVKEGKKLVTKTIEGLDAMLFTMGLDITLPYECEILEHRSEVTGNVVTCERFVGSKRQDHKWKTFEYKMRYNEL